MVFSFRLRKKKNNDTAKTQVQGVKNSASGNRASPKKTKSVAARQRSKRGSNEFGSPLAIAEEEAKSAFGTAKTVPGSSSSPVISNINIVDDEDGLEIVYGDVPVPKLYDDGLEVEYGGAPVPKLYDEIPAGKKQIEAKEDVKRQLFVPDLVDVENEPFDEKEMKKEDPYILELLQSKSNDEADKLREQRKEEEQYKAKEENQYKPKEVMQEDDPLVEGVARKLVGVFNCAGDTTSLFYDSLCAQGQRVKKRKRPYFNEMFALSFIQVR
jgi:hypothetical protein